MWLPAGVLAGTIPAAFLEGDFRWWHTPDGTMYVMVNPRARVMFLRASFSL